MSTAILFFSVELGGAHAPLRFVLAFCPRCFRFARLRILSMAVCSAGSVMGTAMTRCKGAILKGGEAFLDIAHSSCETTRNGCSPFRASPPPRLTSVWRTLTFWNPDRQE